MSLRLIPAGDEAIVAEFGETIDEETNQKVHILSAWISDRKITGVRELLPTFRSLMIFYDSTQTTYKKLVREIKEFAAMDIKEQKTGKKIWLIPCCYDLEFGPDLPDMSVKLNLSKEDIIKIHTEHDYKIYMLGFLPGFVYLGNLDERIHVPRLKTPRLVIPARSVGIGGSQTGVYPMESPGGWNLIGSTPLNFYSPNKENPILCNAGEYIRFCPISQMEYQTIRKEVETGSYQPQYQSEM